MWDAINLLVRVGRSHQTAIDQIYEVYGQSKTVTYIIDRMREDRQNHGIHPDLIPPGHQARLIAGGMNRGNRRARN